MADDIKLVIGVDDRDLVRAEKEQLKFQRNLTSIEKAFRSGKINASRYNSELAKQAKELAKLGGGYNKANSEVRKYAASLRQANEVQLEATQAAGFAGKRVNRLGMQMQQAGYQVGDFAVQLQGGTNMMVALGQQGSQLLGIFGPAGAIAGAALAIGTAFVAPLMRAAKEADELAKSVKSAIEEVDDALRASMLGATEGEMKFIDNIAVLQTELDNLLEQQAADPGGKTQAQLANIASAIRQTKEDLGKANEEFRDYQANVAKLKSFDPLSAFGGAGRDIKEQEKLKTAVTETGELRVKLAFRRQKLFDALRDRQRKAEREEQKAADKIAKTIERANQSARDRLISESYRVDLLEAELEFGKESVRYKNLVALIEDSNLRRKLEAQGVEKATIDAIIKQLDGQRQITAELEKQGRITYRMFEGSDAAKAMRKYASRGTPTGTGKPKKEKEPVVKESDLQKLRKELALESALVGQTEARQRVIQALGVEFSKKNPQTVANLERQIQLTKDLIQEEQKRKDLIGFVADSMGDSFMSMVEGTKSVKDAFREMASDIVRELYRVLVVQQMVNSAKTFMGGFFADGGAFSGGSQIQAYANGGVVGSPTYFGMSGGKTGLMGEAGPEAIMPLSRGANGKLGVQAEGVGGVTINQNINISTGVQQTVRSEIKSMMPQIAEQSKAAVLDAKRRGGSYGSKF